MIIQIDNLTVRYGTDKPVLQQLSCALTGGSITALAAPNGEGKTTLLKAICGLRKANSGQVSVLGQQPAKRSVELLEQLYFLPAEPSLPAWTPQRIGRYYGPFYPNFSESLYRDCLRDFSVDPVRAIGKLSFGQQRRVQLAFALAVRTPILLLDEPTLGLDIAGKDQFRRSLIQATEEGQTVLLATHLLTEVEPVLDDLMVLHEGRITHHLKVSEAYEQFSFTLTNNPPEPSAGTYGRRVPGGWLVVRNDGKAGNARPDLESLYLALTEGRLSPDPTKTNAHV